MRGIFLTKPLYDLDRSWLTFAVDQLEHHLHEMGPEETVLLLSRVCILQQREIEALDPTVLV